MQSPVKHFIDYLPNSSILCSMKIKLNQTKETKRNIRLINYFSVLFIYPTRRYYITFKQHWYKPA